MQIDWLRVMRDAIIVVLFSFAGAVVATLAQVSGYPAMAVIFVTLVLGFALSAWGAPARLPHLAVVAGAVWVLSLVLRVTGLSIGGDLLVGGWLVTPVVLAAAAALGGALAGLRGKPGSGGAPPAD